MIVYKHGQPFLFLGASWDLISSGLVTQMPRSNSTIYFHADVFLKMLNWNVCVCCVYVGRGGHLCAFPGHLSLLLTKITIVNSLKEWWYQKGMFTITWILVQLTIIPSCRTWLTLEVNHPLKNVLRIGVHGISSLESRILEVNMCILDCWEHESWDLPFHVGSK